MCSSVVNFRPRRVFFLVSFYLYYRYVAVVLGFVFCASAFIVVVACLNQVSRVYSCVYTLCYVLAFLQCCLFWRLFDDVSSSRILVFLSSLVCLGCSSFVSCLASRLLFE